MSDSSIPGVPTVHGDRTELAKPIRRVPGIADPAMHKQLRAGLKKHGMSDRAAAAVSTIWVDPASVLAQLDNPQRRRIPGADLLVVTGEVYTARLCPDPLNPRNFDHVTFDLAGAVGSPPMTLALAAEAGVGEMSMTVATRAGLIESVDWAIATTRSRNAPNPDIAEQGIMDAPIGVATTVNYEDGESATTHIFVREGSSRTSHGLYHLGVDAQEVLYALPRAAGPMQMHIERLNGYTAKSADAITASEQAAVRCAVTRFELVIGVISDSPGAVDLSQALKARVAQDHLNVKKGWTDAAKNTSLAEECLISARHEGVIPSDADANWLAGRLTLAQAAAQKIHAHLDDRAARIIHLFTTDEKKVHDSVRKPIALVLNEDKAKGTSRKYVTLTQKLPLAVEMVARELRGTVSDKDLAAFRTVLENSIPANRGANNAWKPTKRSPEELYQAAAKELANAEPGGPAGTELLVRAAYVLAKHKAISGPRHDRGEGSDRRSSAEVLEALLKSDEGLRHLRQAIEDDRVSQPPRQIDANGIPLLDAANEPLLVTNDYLRTQLAPKKGLKPLDVDPELAAVRRYKAKVLETKEALRDLDYAMRDLEGFADVDGNPLIEQRGRDDARLLMEDLEDLWKRAMAWWKAAMMSGGDFTEEDDTEGDDE